MTHARSENQHIHCRMILRTNGYANVLYGLLGMYLIVKERGTKFYDLYVSNGSVEERETQLSQAVSSKVERVHFYPHMTRQTTNDRTRGK